MDFIGLLKSLRRSLPPVFYIYKHYSHKFIKNITFYTAFALVVQPENNSDQRFMQTDSDTTQIAKFMGPTWGPPGAGGGGWGGGGVGLFIISKWPLNMSSR